MSRDDIYLWVMHILENMIKTQNLWINVNFYELGYPDWENLTYNIINNDAKWKYP